MELRWLGADKCNQLWCKILLKLCEHEAEYIFLEENNVSPISWICGAGIFEGQAQGWIASKLELLEEWSSRSRPEMFVEETTGDWFWGLCWQAGSTWQWQAGWHLTMQPLPFDICPHSMTYIPNAGKFYLSKLQSLFYKGKIWSEKILSFMTISSLTKISLTSDEWINWKKIGS